MPKLDSIKLSSTKPSSVRIEFDRSPACEKAQQVIQQAAKELYFCGYHLDKCFEYGLFRELTNRAQVGFCYELAAIAMYLLKSFPLSKIVHGTATLSGEDGEHAVVEFQHGHEDFVLDLAWFGPEPIPVGLYQMAVNLRDINFQVSYQTFWMDAPTKLIYQLLRTPQLSRLLCELAYFRPACADKALITERYNLFGSGSMLDHLSQIGTGYKMLPRPTASGYLIDQNTINNIMSEASLALVI